MAALDQQVAIADQLSPSSFLLCVFLTPAACMPSLNTPTNFLQAFVFSSFPRLHSQHPSPNILLSNKHFTRFTSQTNDPMCSKKNRTYLCCYFAHYLTHTSVVIYVWRKRNYCYPAQKGLEFSNRFLFGEETFLYTVIYTETLTKPR